MTASRNGRLKVVTAYLLLLALIGGAAYVFVIARGRTGMYAQALAARKAGDANTAERLLRSLLEAKPDDDRSRALLVEILAEDRRVKEGEALARYWLERPVTEARGLRALSQLALHRMNARDAVRYARMVADRDPVFAQSMLLQVHDAIGTRESRERSARAAEGLAAVVAAPTAQAAAWLYAAETFRDLEVTLPAGPERQTLTSHKQLDRRKALVALRTAHAWKEGRANARVLMASIELLSDDAHEQQDAARTLEAHLQSHEDAHRARSSMIRYLIAEGKHDRAVEHVRILRNGPILLFLRALSSLAQAGQHEIVLRLLDEMGDKRGPLIERMRARVLISGVAERRAEAIPIFERLALANPEEVALVRESYQHIKQAGAPERALRLLERIGRDNPEVRFAALLERAVVSIEAADAEASAAVLAHIARDAEGGDLLRAFHRMRQLGERGEEAALALVDKTLEADRPGAEGLRLLRAAWTITRSGKDAAGTPWRQRALADLAAIADDDDVSRGVLVNAATLAAAAGDAARLTGRLIGRALTREGERGDPLALFLRIASLTSDADRISAAEGMRAAASRDAQHGSWLRRLAAALAAGDEDRLRVPAAHGSSEEGASQPTEALLQFRLAAKSRDWPEAEAYARRMLTAWPELPGGVERLGAVLLSAERFEEVLRLHAEEKLGPTHRAQRVAALRGLGRQNDAIAEARLLLRATNGSDGALLLLGQLLRNVDPDGAYAAISPITGRVSVDLFRGELLEGRGDEDSAAQVYEDLLRQSGDRNLDAWRHLARVRSAQDRHAAFVLRVTPVIDAPKAQMSTRDVAQLVLLRAMAREGMEDHEGALEDYMRVLSVLPQSVAALNNAAWIIAAQIAWRGDERRERLEQALELANRAVEHAPRLRQVFHTRGRILHKLSRYEPALSDLEKAIGLLESAIAKAMVDRLAEVAIDEMRRGLARYLLDKAAVLEAAGRVEPATAIYERVQRENAGTKEGRLAKAALVRLHG